MTTRSREHPTIITTPSDLEAVLTRDFDAPRRLVWEAFTNPEHIARWMLGPPGWTMPVCENDLRPGGMWHYVWRKNDGSEMEMTGVNREVVLHERIVNTEKWGPEWPETVNTVVFTDHEGGTRVTTTVRYPSREARDAAMKTGMKSGAEQSYARLDEVLRSMAGDR